VPIDTNLFFLFPIVFVIYKLYFRWRLAFVQLFWYYFQINNRNNNWTELWVVWTFNYWKLVSNIQTGTWCRCIYWVYWVRQWCDNGLVRDNFESVRRHYVNSVKQSITVQSLIEQNSSQESQHSICLHYPFVV